MNDDDVIALAKEIAPDFIATPIEIFTMNKTRLIIFARELLRRAKESENG